MAQTSSYPQRPPSVDHRPPGPARPLQAGRAGASTSSSSARARPTACLSGAVDAAAGGLVAMESAQGSAFVLSAFRWSARRCRSGSSPPEPQGLRSRTPGMAGSRHHPIKEPRGCLAPDAGLALTQFMRDPAAMGRSRCSAGQPPLLGTTSNGLLPPTGERRSRRLAAWFRLVSEGGLMKAERDPDVAASSLLALWQGSRSSAGMTSPGTGRSSSSPTDDDLDVNKRR